MNSRLYMFSTFRARLFFWFLIFLSASLLVFGISIVYIKQRAQINRTIELIELSYLTILEKVIAQQSFLSYETKNTAFFNSGESPFLTQADTLSEYAKRLVEEAATVADPVSQKVKMELVQLESDMLAIDSVFALIVDKIKVRGYKSFALEGEMREDAHWLEDISEIPSRSILTLRRHEKDYIIRNEQKYIDQLTALIASLKARINNNPYIRRAREEEILNRLDAYQEKFLKLVTLDEEIGIKGNTGLKQELDQQVQRLELAFGLLVNKAQQLKESKLTYLNYTFGGILGFFFVASLIISYFISRRITLPLTQLTGYITEFVGSNFTLEEGTPPIKNKDEIGKLTENFTVLKEKIIEQLKFFKEKVEERTRDLANANEQLKNINEANSRFVPEEFLHFLGKKSITEIQLGDQTQHEMTILFTDIRSFTQLSETLSPQENFDFINQYLNEIVPIIRKHNGIIDKFIGDNVMALFPDGPEYALRAVSAFDAAVQRFNQRQLKLGRLPIKIGTGIHTGQLILGTIGNEQRLETTVISDAVNIASRVEGLTKFYQADILFTADTLRQLPRESAFHHRFIDFVKVKGKNNTISIYELIAPHEEYKLLYQEKYEEAVILMRSRRIAEAHRLFAHILQQNPDDRAVRVILDRCAGYLRHGLPENWNGVETMRDK